MMLKLFLLISTLNIANLIKAADCIGDSQRFLYPDFIQAASPDASDNIEWRAMAISKNTQNIFLAGTIKSTTLLTAHSDKTHALVARQDVQSDDLVWVKAITDSKYEVEAASAISVNHDDSFLAVAAVSTAHDLRQYIFILDPISGNYKSEAFQWEFNYDSEKMCKSPISHIGNQQLVFAGDDYLYSTAFNFQQNQQNGPGCSLSGQWAFGLMSFARFDMRGGGFTTPLPWDTFYRTTYIDDESFGGGSCGAMFDKGQSIDDGNVDMYIGCTWSPFETSGTGQFKNEFTVHLFQIADRQRLYYLDGQFQLLSSTWTDNTQYPLITVIQKHQKDDKLVSAAQIVSDGPVTIFEAYIFETKYSNGQQIHAKSYKITGQQQETNIIALQVIDSGNTVYGIMYQPGSQATIMFTYLNLNGSPEFEAWVSMVSHKFLVAMTLDNLSVSPDDSSLLSSINNKKTGNFYMAGSSDQIPHTTYTETFTTRAAFLTHAWKWAKTCDSYESRTASMPTFIFEEQFDDTNQLSYIGVKDSSDELDLERDSDYEDIMYAIVSFQLEDLHLSAAVIDELCSNTYLSSVKDPVTITPAVVPDITLTQTNNLTQYKAFTSDFAVQSCNTDFYYVIQDLSGTGIPTRLLTVDSTSVSPPQIVVQLHENPGSTTPYYAGEYDVKLIGITRGLATSETTFKVIITGAYSASCIDSTSGSLTPPAAQADKLHVLGSGLDSIVFAQFTKVGATYCSESDVTYTITSSPDCSFCLLNVEGSNMPGSTTQTNLASGENLEIEIDGSSLTVSDLNTYTITITASLTISTGSVTSTWSVNLVVYDCSTTPESYTVSASSLATSSYVYANDNQVGGMSWLDFSEDSTVCTQSDIVYSVSCSTTCPACLITGNVPQKQLGWYCNDAAQVGLYTITIRGEIISNGVANGADLIISLEIQAMPTCATSTTISDVYTLTAGAVSSTDVFYTIGSGATGSWNFDSAIISGNTKMEALCTNQDIVYTVSPAFTSPPITRNNKTFYINTDSLLDRSTTSYTIVADIVAHRGQANEVSVSYPVITVTIDKCSQGIQITPILADSGSDLSQKVYTLNSPVQSLNFNQMGITSNFCTASDVVYTVDPNNAFVRHTPGTYLIEWDTSDASFIGLVTVSITGSVSDTGVTKTESFTIDVREPEVVVVEEVEEEVIVVEEVEEVVQKTAPFFFRYREETTDSFFVEELSSDSIVLGNPKSDTEDQVTVEIAYTPSQYSKYFSFDLASGTIEIQRSSLLSLSSNEEIYMRIILSDTDQTNPYSTTYMFRFVRSEEEESVELSESSFMTTYTSENLIVNVAALEENQIALDAFEETYQYSSTNELLSIEFMPQSSAQYFEMNLAGESLMIQLDKLSDVAVKQGFLNILVTITLEDKYKGLVQQYLVQFYYSYYEQDDDTRPIFSKLSVDTKGLATINFSKALKPVKPELITILELDLNIIPGDYETENKDFYKKLSFTWKVTQFKEKFMQIQIKFDNPLFITSFGIDFADQLEVICLNPNYFRTKQARIKQGHSITENIPPQLPLGDAEQLESMVSTADTGSKAILITNFVLNVLISQSLGQFWSAINSLQLIAHMSLFNGYFPQNLLSFNSKVIDFVNFDLVPGDLVYDYLGIELPVDHEEKVEAQEKRRLSEASHEILQEDFFVSIFLYILAAILFLGLVIVIFCLFPLSLAYQPARNVILKLKALIFWNSTLRIILEGYMAISLASILVIQKEFSFKQTFEIIQTSLAIAILGLFFILPLFLRYFFAKNFHRFRSEQFLKHYGSVIENLNPRLISSTNYIPIFCYRRLIEVFLIISLSERYYFQVQLMTFMTISMASYMGISDVMASKRWLFIEYFNEICLIVACYHYFLFSAFVPDPLIRYKIGFYMIGVTCFNFGFNIVQILFFTFKNLLMKVKKLMFRNYERLKKAQMQQKLAKIQKRKVEMQQSQETYNQFISHAKNDDEEIRAHAESLFKKQEQEQSLTKQSQHLITRDKQRISRNSMQSLVQQSVQASLPQTRDSFDLTSGYSVGKAQVSVNQMLSECKLEFPLDLYQHNNNFNQETFMLERRQKDYDKYSSQQLLRQPQFDESGLDRPQDKYYEAKEQADSGKVVLARRRIKPGKKNRSDNSLIVKNPPLQEVFASDREESPMESYQQFLKNQLKQHNSTKHMIQKLPMHAIAEEMEQGPRLLKNRGLSQDLQQMPHSMPIQSRNYNQLGRNYYV